MRTGVNRRLAMLGAVGAFAAVSVASADVILTFQFNDLDGEYEMSDPNDPSAGGTFHATAADTAGLRSAGDVTRLLSPAGSANFNEGFVSGADPSDFHLEIEVGPIVGNTAFGIGDVHIFDKDGDELHADIIGAGPGGGWEGDGAGNYFFNAILTDVHFHDAGPQDGMFDGPGGGSFEMLPDEYEGALVQLFTVGGGGFFDHDFDDVNTLVIANVVPAPGALALAGLGALLGARRRGR